LANYSYPNIVSIGMVYELPSYKNQSGLMGRALGGFEKALWQLGRTAFRGTRCSRRRDKLLSEMRTSVCVSWPQCTAALESNLSAGILPIAPEALACFYQFREPDTRDIFRGKTDSRPNQERRGVGARCRWGSVEESMLPIIGRPGGGQSRHAVVSYDRRAISLTTHAHLPR
jgi:hypothetical protein